MTAGWPWPQAQIAGISLSTTSVAVVYAVMIETGFNRTEIGEPKVDSAVVRLTPCHRAAEMGIHDIEAFLGFLSACFRQKRKTLRNNLRESFPIDGHPEGPLRAEQLSLDELSALWHRL